MLDFGFWKCRKYQAPAFHRIQQPESRIKELSAIFLLQNENLIPDPDLLSPAIYRQGPDTFT